MANGRFILGKQSGGTLGLVFLDGVSNTEVVLPESGNIASVGTSVTDNAITRYDGTTGKLQNSGVIVDDGGNVGVGVTPSAWGSSIKAIEQGNRTALFELNGETVLNNNAYYNGTGWIKKTANACSMYEMLNGAHYWSTAPSGTAGSTTAWTHAMTLDASGYLYFGGDIGDTTTTGMRRGDSGQLILRASNSGLYHQAGTSYYLITTAGGSTSDITLKKDIEVIPNSLNKILNLKGVYYEFIEEQLCTADQGKQIGVIAQNVEQEFPEIVLTNEDGVKTVRYDRLIAPMIEAIKEQQEIINDLKVRIEKLELGAK